MTITEKAKAYADGKALEFITKALECAFEDGYRAGYADRDSEIPEDLKSADGIEYLDLGLPSGTKWAFVVDSSASITMRQAEKLNTPSEKQVKELLKECNVQRNGSNLCIDAPNGEGFSFYWNSDNAIWLNEPKPCSNDQFFPFYLLGDNKGNSKGTMNPSTKLHRVLVK